MAASKKASIAKLVSVIDRIAAKHGGMAPIALIREAMGKNTDMLLLEAEKAYIIDLKTANDPRRIDLKDTILVRDWQGYPVYFAWAIVR